MNNLDEQLNKALEMLKQGQTQEDILEAFADSKQELAPLLKTGEQLFALPINIVPTPVMRRSYLKAKSFSVFSGFRIFSKISIASMSFAVLAAFVVTAYAAEQSAPGDKLFELKKLGEKTQLAFAGDQGSRATLEIKITQKRLFETPLPAERIEINF